MAHPPLVVKVISDRAGNQTQESALSILLFERRPEKPVAISRPEQGPLLLCFSRYRFPMKKH